MEEKRGSLFSSNKKRGQIWVETIIYTLIAFVLIGLVMAFVKPKIEEIRDKNIIEQSISILQDINSLIKDLGVSGNQRVIQLGISEGTLNINGETDILFFEIESRNVYSEPGENVTIGNIIVFTEEKGKINDVTLTLDYEEDYNLTYQNRDELKMISAASTPYTLLITNKGKDSSNKTIINMEVTN